MRNYNSVFVCIYIYECLNIRFHESNCVYRMFMKFVRLIKLEQSKAIDEVVEVFFPSKQNETINQIKVF